MCNKFKFHIPNTSEFMAGISFTSTFILVLTLAVMALLYAVMRVLLGKQMAENEKEVRSLKETLEGLQPGIKDGSVIPCYIDRKEMYMEFDKDAAKMAGMPTHKWTVESFRALLNSDSMNVFEMWIKNYTQLHDPVDRRLRFHITLDGGKTYHWWELIYKLDETNAYSTWFDCLFSNIDGVKDIENAIEDAHDVVYEVENKEAFLAAINHDLRTPLNAVTGFATLLAEQYDDFSDEERQEFHDYVCSNSESMLQLIDSIKTTSDKEMADKSYRIVPKSVTELLNFCYSTNKIICPSHLHFNLEMPEGVEDKCIHIDIMRIERVINNFLSNAFKFTSVGDVTLGWKFLEEPRQVEIYVTDTGIGIARENQPRVFDEYIKLNEHAHGTGLGLNICKKIVEKHGGEIGLTSELGQGSTFYCRFNTAPEGK